MLTLILGQNAYQWMYVHSEYQASVTSDSSLWSFQLLICPYLTSLKPLAQTHTVHAKIDSIHKCSFNKSTWDTVNDNWLIRVISLCSPLHTAHNHLIRIHIAVFFNQLLFPLFMCTTNYYKNVFMYLAHLFLVIPSITTRLFHIILFNFMQLNEAI